MPQMRRFDFLNDGQRLPEHEDGTLHSADAVGILSARSMEDKKRVLTKQVLQYVGQMTTRMEDLGQKLADWLQQLPVGNSIFPKDSERTAAYCAICRVLLMLESELRQLRIPAAELTRCEEALRFLSATTDLLEDLSGVAAQAVDFCRKTVPDFCDRMKKIADTEHDGNGCNPVAAVRLLGELKNAVNKNYAAFRAFSQKWT